MGKRVLVLSLCVVLSLCTFVGCSNNLKAKTLDEGYSIGYRDSGSEYEGVYFDIGMEEQHSWNVIGENTSFTVKWVNNTQNAVDYNLECYIYKQTNNDWELCSTEEIDFLDVIYILNAGEVKSQQYSISGYAINESGRYKFVTFVDGKAVWVEFEVKIESNNVLQ